MTCDMLPSRNYPARKKSAMPMIIHFNFNNCEHFAHLCCADKWRTNYIGPILSNLANDGERPQLNYKDNDIL